MRWLIPILVLIAIGFAAWKALPFLTLSDGQIPKIEKPSSSKAVASMKGKVVKIKDGDSVVLLKGEEDFQVVRLQHIDAPENGQAFAQEAWEHLSKLCRQKEVVVILSEEEDRYNRVIGELFLTDGTCVNREMVRAGLAWHFAKFSDRKDYARLQIEAQAQRKGLWAEQSPVPPHKWREQKEQLEATENNSASQPL